MLYEVITHEIDCAISSNFLSINMDDIEYTRTYLSTYEVVICKKDAKYFRIEDLKGKKIGVLKNSKSEEKGKSLLKSMNFILVPYDNSA